ncbi:uncharacterized protein LOC110857767 [Folsomia candida]|uniref:Uncharacterized protein n=1 Tax=Folsomia candida TaxID=158441 RepID=A0A226DIB5_FOLCA|nr:uncharacterized protein LOC110857767 [Folsomia candida]OXA44331.1 hypothetical protein Fcan01_20889 [Folsomia candida]
MLKTVTLIALLVSDSAASAIHGASLVQKGADATFDATILGIVDPAHRCENGVGLPQQLRISDCEGRCQFNPGQIYNCELDFLSGGSETHSLTLQIEICMIESVSCTVILNVELPNSPVQPGFMYTVKYSITPDEVLSGQAVEFYTRLFNTKFDILQVCVTAEIDIL